MTTPNWFAIFVLVVWPLVALYLYLSRPATQATLWTILGAYLLLPVGAVLHFSGIPQLDKETSGNLGALLGIVLILRRPLRFWNGFGIAEVLLLMLLLGPFITAELNSDQIYFPGRVVPGGSHYDALSEVVRKFLLLIPFFIGRQFLRAPSDIKSILRCLVIAGLLYSVPILFEIRMAPVLQTWIYGFFATSFVEQLRNGGYRPVVFLGHGLAVALFIVTTAMASTALWRSRARIGQLPSSGITAYLSVILILCKGLGSLIYGGVLIPLIYLTKPRFQARVAMVIAAIALCYPLLRSTDVVPVQTMLDMAAVVSQDRSDSLGTRFTNEDRLLKHASDRFFFGWGRFGRNLVYDRTGRDISIPDGEWVIVLGEFGLVGFVGEFGLLALAIYRAASALKFAESERDAIYLATLLLIVAVCTVDLLPNSGLSPWTWLLAGVLMGRAEYLMAMARQRATVALTALHRAKTLPAS
jgi:hypothetical protein